MLLVRESILGNMSEDEKNAILNEQRYLDYAEVYGDDIDAILEEFVADTLAEMNTHTEQYADVVSEYWNGGDVDSFKVSEYTESIDAGGDAKKLSIDSFKQLILSKQEYAMVSKAIANKNAGIKNSELQSVDYVFAADNFYMYENKSVGEFVVIDKLNPETESEKINILVGAVNNGIYSNTDGRSFIRRADSLQSGQEGSSLLSGRSKNERATAKDDKVYDRPYRRRQADSNSIGHSGRMGQNTTNRKIKLSLSDDGYFDLIDLAEGRYTDAELRTYAEPPAKKKGATRSNKGTKASRDMDNAASHENRWNTEKVGTDEKSDGSPVNIADIVKKISDKFEIPISTGKVNVKDASGIYKERAEAIRTRITNNLPTISHELGHHLDKQYGLSELGSVDALLKVIPSEFLDNYADSEKNGEAVAEFIRVYLKNTNDAHRLCPNFYTDFVRTLSDADLKSLNEIATSVNQYLSADFSSRVDSAIVSSSKKESVPFRDRWNKIYTDWIDAFHPTKEAVDYVKKVVGGDLSGTGNAYTLATNSLNAHTVANYLICEGFRDLNGNIVDAKSFVDSIGNTGITQNNSVNKVAWLPNTDWKVASEIITRNATAIKNAGEYYEVNPAIIAACIYTEQTTNVNALDYITDVPAYFLDTSIGIGQIKVSTAKMLEDAGYIEKTTYSHSYQDWHAQSYITKDVWYALAYGYVEGSREKAIAYRLTNESENVNYVAAYLRYFQDRWKPYYPEIDGRTAILATLFNQGELRSPHDNPQANPFGEQAKKEYYYMRDLLGLD